jgi:acetyl-CoA carboxylase biotin carboxyl carrier protein
MPGTFYSSPSPEAAPFIKEGDVVSKGDSLCIIEAMKIMNEIEAEKSGTIKKLLVDDGSAVDYNQPLFLIDPS